MKNLIDELNKQFNIESFPKDFIKAHTNENGDFCLRIGWRDIQLDKDGDFIGAGSDLKLMQKYCIDPADKIRYPFSPNSENANLTFGEATEAMKDGHKVCRKGWNGKNMWIAIQMPDEHSKMTQPYIYMFTAQGDLIPWLASQADMLAVDWMISDYVIIE